MQIIIGAKLANKTGETPKAIDVATGNLPAHVKDFIFEYGLRQILNDAGSAQTTIADKHAIALKRLDALYAGELRVRRAADNLSPLEAEIERLARADAVAFFKAKKLKVKDLDEAELDAKTEEFRLEFLDDYTAMAEKALDEARLARERAQRMLRK